MAAYDLTLVRALVGKKAIVIGRNNTLLKVAEALSAESTFSNDLENRALELMLEVLGCLRADNLSKKPWPARGDRPAMDEYGVCDKRGRSWYVKFFVRDERVVLCSFHRPEHDIETAGGCVRK